MRVIDNLPVNDTEASIRDGEQSLSDDDFVSNTA